MTIKTVILTALFTSGITIGGGAAFAAGSHKDGHGAKKGHHDEKSEGHGKSGGKSGGHCHVMSIGEPGKSGAVDRTIIVKMSDNFFEPEEIEIKKGETIRFVITNKGEFLHEFNIGTTTMHEAHQKEMAMMAEHGMITPTGIDHEKMKMDHGDGKMMMDHNDPNSALVEPGKSAEVIWHFTKNTELEFACNVPGHYDAGMMGAIKFNHAH